MTRPPTSQLLYLLLTLLLLPGVLHAAEPRPLEIVGVQVGFAGHYKVGLWTPVRVTLRGGSQPVAGRLSITVPDGDGVLSRVSAPADEPCTVPAEQESTVSLCVRFGRVKCTLRAEFSVDGQVVAHQEFAVGPKADEQRNDQHAELQRLIVTVGSADPGVDQALLLQGLAPGGIAARVDDVGQLPTAWYGYEGVDALLLCTSKPEIYRSLNNDDPRVEALDQWVCRGGMLVLSVGSQGQAILAEGSPLRRFAPGRLEKMVPLRQTGVLETYAHSTTGIAQSSGGQRQSPRVPQLTEIVGAVEVNEGGLPLVIRAAHGLGQVVFVAVDLDQPPIASWRERGLLVAKLLDFPPPQLEESSQNVPVMHYGYDDMAGQLRSALDRFQGVRLVPFWVVAGLVALYILMIGPADYFLLSKFARRMTWTWLSFPLIVLLFSAAAYALAYQFKGDQLRIHQADLFDVDMASGRVRSTTWLNVFSPASQSFNLSLRPRLPDGKTPAGTPVLFSWLGLPGAGLGGMNPRASEPLPGGLPYEISPARDAVQGVPIQVWSTKSLTAQFSATAGPWLKIDLSNESQLPRGTITNMLDFPLSHCVLAWEGWAYELGTLEPGRPAHVGPETTRSTLKTLLTGYKIVFEASAKDKYRHEVTPYDQSSVDVPYILRAMMFFAASGGQQYTGLNNDYQRFVDLSGLLKSDRAILVGEGPSGGDKQPGHPELLRDGQPLNGPQDEHASVYRFVFPTK